MAWRYQLTENRDKYLLGTEMSVWGVINTPGSDNVKNDITLSSASKGIRDENSSLGLEQKNLFGSDVEQGWTVATRTSGATQKVRVNVGGLANEKPWGGISMT